ncbi:MAG: hypothetical protein MUC96_07010 [Myxococcaceae bacterium]|jgi:hypothetical protein|nr:hypothetical protein [Myxococcaceae bacterium]
MLRLLCGVLTALTLACQPAMAPPVEDGPPVWVGRVDGTDALVGVALEEGTVVAYVCGKDSWETRTGWFSTQLADGATDEGDVVPAQSASGHVLERARLERRTVKGTLRFGDGLTTTFTAERANPATAAGLYDSTSSEGQAGLIITNDLDSAGAAAAIGGDGTTTRAPVQVTSNPTSGATLVSGLRTVTVSIPNLGVTNLTQVIPTQQAVTSQSPVLYVLVHGMSHSAGTSTSTIDTPPVSRDEWSVDFLRGLLGARPGARNPLFSFVGPFDDADYRTAGATFPATLAEVDIAANPGLPANFVTLVPVAPVPSGFPAAAARPAPPFSAFITYRDVPGGLVQSGQRIASQAYLALRWYELQFRRTPRVIFVTQSFGGVTSRFVLSAPTTQELRDAQVPFDGLTLTTEDTRRMVYVRDRTVSLVTLGTPHEGSFLADLGVPMQMAARRMSAVARNEVVGTGSDLDVFADTMRRFAQTFPSLAPTSLRADEVQATVGAGFDELDRQLNGRALRDLRRDFWERVNRGPLHPRKARRGSSPIQGGAQALIPVYAGGSRSPGGRAFTAPELSAFPRYASENERERGWIVMTMGSDTGVRLLRTEGFGRTSNPVLSGFAERLDRRERLADLGVAARAQAQALGAQLSPWLVDQQPTPSGTDAFVALALGPAQGLGLPVYLDQRGAFDLSGQASAPALGFACADGGQSFRIVLDFGRLLTALVATYSSLSNARQAIAAQDLNRMLTALNLVSADVDAVKQWFLDKYAALQVPEGRCRLPSDVSLASLLSVANLPNWQLAVGMDRFPAPRWVRSGQRASDGEIDSDGAVAFDSAMGLTLGTTTPLFFDHERTDDVRNGVPSVGSWYRFFDSPIEADNHGMQHQFVAGEWIFTTFAPAGPAPQRNGLGRF